MLRILRVPCAALALLIVMAFPFAKEAYHRYEVSKRLGPVMTDRDRADFQQWNGNAQGFRAHAVRALPAAKGARRAGLRPDQVSDALSPARRSAPP